VYIVILEEFIYTVRLSKKHKPRDKY